MSIAPPQAYTKETVKKALAWLSEQQPDWAHHIKDIDIAVRLYLKSKTQNSLKIKQNIFTEELKKICMDSCEFPKEESISETQNEEKVKESSPPAIDETNSTRYLDPSSFLDSRSQSFIEKTKDQLNLTQDDEVLRLLIRMGYNSIKSLLR